MFSAMKNTKATKHPTDAPFDSLGLVSFSLLQWAGIAIAILSLCALVVGGVNHLIDGRVADAERRAEAAEAKVKETNKQAAELFDSGKKFIDKINLQKGESDALRTKLSSALRRSPDCTLSADVGRLLRNATRVPASAATDPGPGSQAAATDQPGRGGEATEQPVSCQAITVWANENLARMQTNILQTEDIQAAYEIVRKSHERQSP